MIFVRLKCTIVVRTLIFLTIFLISASLLLRELKFFTSVRKQVEVSSHLFVSLCFLLMLRKLLILDLMMQVANSLDADCQII